MYEDKLDGKVDEQFWARKINEWREQERALEAQLSALSKQVTAEGVLTVQRVFDSRTRLIFFTLREIQRNAANC